MRNPFISYALILLALAGCGGGGGGNPTVDDQAYAVAIQSDGKIIAAGESLDGGNFQWSFALARYNTDGSLDPGFGAGGKVLTNMGDVVARAVVIQSNGKIIAAGKGYPSGFALVRYNIDGTLDAGFGSGGKVLTAINGGATAVAIQGDGSIVAAGYFYNGSGYDFAVARYLVSGTLDLSFGSGGVVITAVGSGFGASGVAIQADGKILVAGGSYLVRYNFDGSLDTFFGNNGIVYTGSYNEQTSTVAIPAAGQILAAGSSYNGFSGFSYDLTLSRYNDIDGTFDTSFAILGTATITASSYYNLDRTTIVPDSVTGKIVVAGYTQYGGFVLARYDSNGSPDTTFNSGNGILANGGSYWNYNSTVRNIAVQTDGKIVVVGRSYLDNVNGYDFALTRLNGDGSIDAAFGTSGKVTTGF